MDALTALLRQVDFHSFLGGFASCHRPFGMTELAAQDCFAQLHVAVSKQASVNIDGQELGVIQAGDVVLVRDGSSISVADKAGRACTQVDELVAQATDPFRMMVGPPHHPGDADFLVFCGSVRFAGNGAHPLFRSLPAALHASGSEQRPVQHALVQCLRTMHGEPQDFEAAQITFLMQAWFVEAIGKVIHSQPRGMGWLTGLADSRPVSCADRDT